MKKNSLLAVSFCLCLPFVSFAMETCLASLHDCETTLNTYLEQNIASPNVEQLQQHKNNLDQLRMQVSQVNSSYSENNGEFRAIQKNILDKIDSEIFATQEEMVIHRMAPLAHYLANAILSNNHLTDW